MHPPQTFVTHDELLHALPLIERLNRLKSVLVAHNFFVPVAKKMRRKKFSDLGRVSARITAKGILVRSRQATPDDCRKLANVLSEDMSFIFGIWAINAPDRIRFDVDKFTEQFVTPLAKELEYFGIAPGQNPNSRTEAPEKLLLKIARSQARWDDYSRRTHAIGDYDPCIPIKVGLM